MSPEKKLKKTVHETQIPKNKKEKGENPSKRHKSENNREEELQSLRRKNFAPACKQASCNACFNYRKIFLLYCLPACVKNNVCIHLNNNITIQEISSHAEEAFFIDSRQFMWYRALEVCKMCITTTQYLSVNVLKEIVEIIMNAHENKPAGYIVSDLLYECQKVLQQNINTHPPCHTKQMQQYYYQFLTSPLDLKDNSLTNRKEFGSDQGIVKYCLNRLEYELSSESNDKCIVDKDEHSIPEDLKYSVQGLQWQKETFEIYECLERNDRIDRLMAVLEVIIEVIQLDLVIWRARYGSNSSTHIMKSRKPLLALILWSSNMYIGAVTNNCVQIIKLFVQLVHLKYPENHVRVMTIWLNALIQTFYICEANSDKDYPNVGRYSTGFANHFYRTIADLPQESIIRIIETVQPTYMKHMIGTLHLKKLLATKEECVVQHLIDFINGSQWKKYQKSDGNIQLYYYEDFFNVPTKEPKEKYSMLDYLLYLCERDMSKDLSENYENKCYPKMCKNILKGGHITYKNVIHTLYITLEAFLVCYSMHSFQNILNKLNEKIMLPDYSNDMTNQTLPEMTSYDVTEEFVKKYRHICQKLSTLVLLFNKLKGSNDIPEELKIFNNIYLFDL